MIFKMKHKEFHKFFLVFELCEKLSWTRERCLIGHKYSMLMHARWCDYGWAILVVLKKSNFRLLLHILAVTQWVNCYSRQGLLSIWSDHGLVREAELSAIKVFCRAEKNLYQKSTSSGSPKISMQKLLVWSSLLY